MHVQTLVDQLNLDWQRTIADHPSRYDNIGEFTGDELVTMISTAPNTQSRNTLLRLLLECDREGHPTAARVVLQAFMPLALSTAQATIATSPSLVWRDVLDDVTTFLWELVRTLPRTSFDAIPGNLKMRLRKGIRNFLGHTTMVSEQPMSQEWWEQMPADISGSSVDAAQRPSPDPVSDLTTILAWAADHSSLTRAQLSLLARIELAECRENACDDFCAEAGITRRTLDRRIERAHNSLIAFTAGHVAAELAA